MIYRLARSLLFRLNPELAHGVVAGLMARSGGFSPIRAAVKAAFPVPETQGVDAFGLHFPNPVGLAAGWDKEGEAWWGVSALGFGHVEIGTVTPKPQPGNPKPRVFRLPEHRSLINRMGFPGSGADAVARNLARVPERGDLILGVNIGKQKTTPLEEAAEDYCVLMEKFAAMADYLAVNISSPNTPGLRKLQHQESLRPLLGRVAEQKKKLQQELGRRVPLLVKVAPDLDDEGIRGAVDAIVEAGMDGIIATNTTIGRKGVEDSPLADETGGLSGEALRDLSMDFLGKVLGHLGGAIPVISVGGIMTADDALARLDAGAVLVQLFTGLIYTGPALPSAIVKSVVRGAEKVRGSSNDGG